jgi:DNA-binding Lrp family transcriptional regulator
VRISQAGVCGSLAVSFGALAPARHAPAASREIFEKHLREIPAVLAAWHVTGDVDYETLITCRDFAALAVCLANCAAVAAER